MKTQNFVTTTRIVTEEIALATGVNLVLRRGIHGDEMEIHTKDGAFAIPEADVKRIRAFGVSSPPQSTMQKPRIPVVSQVQAPAAAKRGGRKPKEEPPVVAPAKRKTDPSRLAKRYTEAEKAELLVGFNAAKSKNQYSKDVNVAIESLRRWNSVAK